MRILVVTAVVAERDAVVSRLGSVTTTAVGPYDALAVTTPAGQITAVAGGVGPSAAAAVTATALALASYDVAINIGIAGAFRGGGLSETEVAVATSLIAADLGAWAPDGFLDFSAIGLDGGGGVTADPRWSAHITSELVSAGIPTLAGAILTLSAMTGTDARADELFTRHHAVAEAMEGAGMAEAASRHGCPVLEVRTMSNLVGDRDREVWTLGPALERITEITPIIFGAPWPTR